MPKDRERGVKTTILDLTQLEDECSAWVREKRLDLVDQGVDGVETRFGPWATFKDALGNTVLVCNEGVAFYVLEEAPAEIGVYATYGEQPKTLSLAPLGEAKVTLDYIEANSTDEVVDLADLIRTFGQRLEDNFRAVRALATSPEKAREAVESWQSEDDQTHV